ncbi:hypothetical protein L7F22_050352 [Adiantum nelumboides]|nr:hypothetical protein [Adiantum nelumboides]
MRGGRSRGGRSSSRRRKQKRKGEGTSLLLQQNEGDNKRLRLEGPPRRTGPGSLRGSMEFPFRGLAVACYGPVTPAPGPPVPSRMQVVELCAFFSRILELLVVQSYVDVIDATYLAGFVVWELQQQPKSGLGTSSALAGDWVEVGRTPPHPDLEIIDEREPVERNLYHLGVLSV